MKRYRLHEGADRHYGGFTVEGLTRSQLNAIIRGLEAIEVSGTDDENQEVSALLMFLMDREKYFAQDDDTFGPDYERTGTE